MQIIEMINYITIIFIFIVQLINSVKNLMNEVIFQSLDSTALSLLLLTINFTYLLRYFLLSSI